jgi:toxin YoeB
MARRLAFTPMAWDNYLYWQAQDERVLDRLNELIRTCLRDPFGGIGKPEALKGGLAGLWSRRIDQMHRLVYRIETDEVQVISCRYLYGDR